MTPEYVTGFFLEAIKTAIILAAPILLAGLVVGIIDQCHPGRHLDKRDDHDVYSQNAGSGDCTAHFFPLDAAGNDRIHSEPIDQFTHCDPLKKIT